jgi:hypothetical protein
MRRPELFSHGNLLRVMVLVSCTHSECNQIILFSFVVCNKLEETFVSPAKEYYSLVLLELGKPFWPRHLQQKLVQILSA